MLDRNHTKICDVYETVQTSSSAAKETTSEYHASAMSALERIQNGLTAQESSSKEHHSEILKVRGFRLFFHAHSQSISFFSCRRTPSNISQKEAKDESRKSALNFPTSPRASSSCLALTRLTRRSSVTAFLNWERATAVLVVSC